MAIRQNNLVEIKRQKNNPFNNIELDVIKRTLAKGASEDEFVMFMHIVETYDLDPFNKEIWFIKEDNKRPIIMTSRDGYLKIADRHPEYSGMVSDVVHKGDRFRRKEDGVSHEYGTNRGPIVGAYALVYRKDRRYPTYTFAPFREYNAATKVWSQYPSAMILKVAESMALKRAFTVSGLVSWEEMDSNCPIDHKAYERDNEGYGDAKNQERKLTKRELMIKKLVEDDESLRKILYFYLSRVKERENRKITRIDDLTSNQFYELINVMTCANEGTVKS
ncbi:MAG: RecT family recombinase [Halanaerobiales bacterium]